jgi:hypothetical protein
MGNGEWGMGNGETIAALYFIREFVALINQTQFAKNIKVTPFKKSCIRLNLH